MSTWQKQPKFFKELFQISLFVSLYDENIVENIFDEIDSNRNNSILTFKIIVFCFAKNAKPISLIWINKFTIQLPQFLRKS